jgi:hypothetical protein
MPLKTGRNISPHATYREEPLGICMVPLDWSLDTDQQSGL